MNYRDVSNHIYRDGFEDLEIVYNLLGVTDYRDQVEMLMDDILKGEFTVDPVTCLGKDGCIFSWYNDSNCH